MGADQGGSLATSNEGEQGKTNESQLDDVPDAHGAFEEETNTKQYKRIKYLKDQSHNALIWPDVFYYDMLYFKASAYTGKSSADTQQ